MFWWLMTTCPNVSVSSECVKCAFGVGAITVGNLVVATPLVAAGIVDVVETLKK